MIYVKHDSVYDLRYLTWRVTIYFLAWIIARNLRMKERDGIY